jgi:PAS domain S-box-containing protein
MTMMEPMRDHDLGQPGLLGGDSELLLADTVLACNPQAASMLGWQCETLVGRPWAELMPERQPDGSPSREGFAQRLDAAHGGLPQSFVWVLSGPSGREVQVIVSLESAVREGRNVASVRLHDLSGLRRAEQDLIETETRLRQVLENTSAVVFIKDPAGRYLYVNQRFCEMFGRSEEELLRSCDTDVFPPQIAKRLRSDDKRVMAAGRPLEIEEHLIVEGKPCVYLAIKFPLVNQAGEPYAVCGIATDITRRKRTEEALRSAALAVSTAEGGQIYQELTRYLATTLGVECAFIAVCTNNEATHVRTLAVYADGDFETDIEYDLPGTACGSVVGQDFRCVPTGVRELYPQDRMFRRLSIEAYAAYPLNGSDGRALGVIAVLSRRPLTDRELTESMLKIFATRAVAEVERQLVEQARRISEESYRAIFEAAEDAIFVHDWDSGAIVDVNPKACEHFGYSREEMKRLRIGDFSSNVPPYTEEDGLRHIEQAKSGAPVRFEWHRKSRDGSLHWDEACLKPVVIAGERRVLAFTREITQRKQAEDALRSAALAVSSVEGDTVFRDLARQLATTLNVAICFIARFVEEDPSRTRMRTLACWMDGKFVKDYEYSLKGTPCEAVVGRRFLFFPHGIREIFSEGTFRPLGVESYAAFPLFDTQGRSQGLIAVVDRKPMADEALIESVLKIFAARAASEIERKGAEEELRASEEQYRAIFNTSVDGMVVLDAQGRTVDANPAFLEMLGYRRDEILGAYPRQLVPPDSLDVCSELANTAARGGSFHSECHALRRDGAVLDVEVRGLQMVYQGHPHVLVICRDITVKKRAEVERAQLEGQLRQAQKMEAIGHLTGGIAHDFNNILTSIMGYSVLAGERVADLGDARLAKYLEQMHVAAVRARDLIQQMLTFSRGKRGEPRPLSLTPLVKESVKLLRSTLPSSIEIQTELHSDVPAVLLDPVQIDQVLLNLCINARDAVSGTGTIRVSVRRAEGVDHVCASCRKPVRGEEMVEISVQDSGCGIPPAIIDRMFEPFFSTKEVGKGSGMGLATVHGIVHEHGGHVVLETAVDRGTTFRVLFPPLADSVAAAPSEPRPKANGARPVTRLDGRVLVVDDEEMVGEFMGDLLTNWGLQVTVIDSAVEARDMFVRDPSAFDLVLTDQTMPRLTGLQLADDLLAARPGLPVILYTGYSENITSEQLDRAGVRAIVKKPIDPSALLAILRRHLGGDPKGSDRKGVTDTA